MAAFQALLASSWLIEVAILMGLTHASMAYRGRQCDRQGACEMCCSWPAFCKLLAVDAQGSQILAPPTGAGSDVRRGLLQLLASLWLSINRC